MARRPSSAIQSKSSTCPALTLVRVVVELLVGEQAGLDPLGELDLLLGVEQRDLADLLQVVLDRVGGRAGGHHLLLGLVGVVGLGQGEALVLGQLALELGLLDRLEGGLVDVVQGALLADREHDLVGLEVQHDVGRPRRPPPRVLATSTTSTSSGTSSTARSVLRASFAGAGRAFRRGRARRLVFAAPASPPRRPPPSADAFLAVAFFVAGAFLAAGAASTAGSDGWTSERWRRRGLIESWRGCHKDLSDYLAKLGQAAPIGCQ